MNSSPRKTISPIPSKLMQLRKKRICRFCKDGARYIDYKDIKMLSSYASERGRIPPRRISGNCAFHQRRLTQAIKRARTMGLLAFTGS